MSTRTYNKLHVSTNREEGSEKIYLGYQNSSTEYPLLKDRETYFHIPPYTASVPISGTTLIIDGAIGGLFPAVSDRISESRKNYGKVSNNGTSSAIPDGTWFCSWLYRNPVTGELTWYDRYFDPKKLDIALYSTETYNGSNYILNAPLSLDAPDINTVIYDVPTTMLLESGVLYKYFHIGEKTAQNLLTTFGGVSGEYLLLDVHDWSSSGTNQYPVTVATSASSESVFVNPSSSQQVVLTSGLGFNNNSNVQAYIDWNQNYIPTHDFTMGVWCQSNDWNTCPSTQLVGNYSTRGGFGIFVDTLKTFPFFVIPETTFGHLIFLNQDGQGFLDKVVISQLSSQSLFIPKLLTVDMNDCLFVCSEGQTPSLYKMDHGGNLLASRTLGLSNDETVVSLAWDEINKHLLVTTTYAMSSFNQNLIHIGLSSNNLSPSSGYAASAFTYNTSLSTHSLVTIPNALDLKFIEDVSWYILDDLYVYKNDQLFLAPEGGATNLHIAPDGNIWILHGTNNVSVYDPNVGIFGAPLFSFTVGTDTYHSVKHISFINQYDRATLSTQWVSVIYYKDTHFVYLNKLNGKVFDIIDINPFINYRVARQLNQDFYNRDFQYGTTGDFTGYETKRVFNALNPHKKLVLKAALRDKTSSIYRYEILKASVSIDDWDKNTWKHIVVTHKNRTMSLYLNGIEQASFQYNGRYELDFDQQPALYVGSPLGVSKGLNSEVGSITSIFNGTIGDIKLYNYSIDPTLLEIFLRAGIAAEDMIWSIPIPSVNYIEKIERLFKNKLPGSKSSFYDIKLAGTNITDPTTRMLFEEQIKAVVSEISPLHTDLIKVTWLG
jgi:hypothetical protein